MTTFAAPERYVVALLFATQKWAAPALVLFGLIAWIWFTPPVGIDTVRITLLVVFALAAWLGHTTGVAEEPAQELISSSSHGSAARILIAKWSTATVVAVTFPLLLLAAICIDDLSAATPRFATQQALLAVIALLAAAATGAALGVLVAGIVPGHPGWAASILTVVSLAQAAPWIVPVPQLAASLPANGEMFRTTGLPVYGLVVILTATLLTAARLVRRATH